MTHTAIRRVQIREEDDQLTESALVQHAANDHGLPACGQVIRPWCGKTMVAVATGPGEVSCLRPGCSA